MSEIDTYGGLPAIRKRRLTLGTITGTRKAMARLAKMYFRQEIDTETYRTLVYGLSHLLAAYRLEKDLEIEKEIQEIRAMLEARQ